MELSATEAQVLLLTIGGFLVFSAGLFRADVKKGLARKLVDYWMVFWVAFCLFHLGLIISDLHKVAMS